MSLIIIGKKGFIAKNLTLFFKKKKIKFLNISLNNFLKLDLKKISGFKNIINCSINKKIVNNKYNINYDYDKIISKKILGLNIRYIFLSSRKVYGDNIFASEKSIPHPKCNYSKNKIIAENSCKKILKNKLIILRISNIIGYRKFSKQRVHKTFIDNFFENLQKKKIIFNFKNYKDFITIDQFCEIISKISRKSNIFGIFNVSMGKKIYLIDLVNSLTKYNLNKISIINNENIKSENFILDNRKLLKNFSVNISKKKLIDYCHKLGKDNI